MAQLAKTVVGVYVLENGDCIDSAQVAEDDLEAVVEQHPLEEQYPDADQVVLALDMIADLSGESMDTIRRRQVEAAIQYTRGMLSEAEDRDQILVQAVRALDDVNEQNNELSERLRPWYRLHFPELEEQLGDNAAFAEQVAAEAVREKIDAELAEESTGMPFNTQDAAMVSRFAAHLSDGYQLREELEAYVESLSQEVVPNLAAVLGDVLAARMVSEAGSLEKLAKMPSSTVQVLGAEKAMFRHMKGEGEAPKHGILFMHPLVQQAPHDDRGKMARVIANKATIAARIDQYGGDFKGGSLRDEVRETFEAL